MSFILFHLLLLSHPVEIKRRRGRCCGLLVGIASSSSAAASPAAAAHSPLSAVGAVCAGVHVVAGAARRHLCAVRPRGRGPGSLEQLRRVAVVGGA